jgi:hypothetical protein
MKKLNFNIGVFLILIAIIILIAVFIFQQFNEKEKKYLSIFSGTLDFNVTASTQAVNYKGISRVLFHEKVNELLKQKKKLNTELDYTLSQNINGSLVLKAVFKHNSKKDFKSFKQEVIDVYSSLPKILNSRIKKDYQELYDLISVSNKYDEVQSFEINLLSKSDLFLDVTPEINIKFRKQGLTNFEVYSLALIISTILILIGIFDIFFLKKKKLHLINKFFI